MNAWLEVPRGWLDSLGEIARFGGRVMGIVYSGRVLRFFGESLRQAGILILGSALVIWGLIFVLGLQCGIQGAYLLRANGAPAYAGVFSAWQQQALDVKPRKLAWAIVVLAIPLGSLAGDSALHLWLDHGNMRALGIGALIITVVSAMFHWHIMQNGAMLVGRNSRSFTDDMKRMPHLTASFICEPIRAVLNRTRAEQLSAKADEAEIAI